MVSLRRRPPLRPPSRSLPPLVWLSLLLGLLGFPAARGFSCRDQHENPHELCAHGPPAGGDTTPPVPTRTGCCCPVTQGELAKFFGEAFAHAGFYAGFCKFAENRDLTHDRLLQRYQTRCDRREAAALYDAVCTVMGQIGGAVVEQLGLTSKSFQTNTASDDCMAYADKNVMFWRSSTEGERKMGDWVARSCPCVEENPTWNKRGIEDELPKDLSHCVKEGYCDFMKKAADPSSGSCDHGFGVGSKARKAEAVVEEALEEQRRRARSREDPEIGHRIAEQARERKEAESLAKFRNDQPFVQLNRHAVKSAEQRHAHIQRGGQQRLSAVEMCCGPDPPSREAGQPQWKPWADCARKFRKAWHPSSDDPYCFYYLEQRKEETAGRRRHQNGGGVGLGSSMRHGRKEHNRAAAAGTAEALTWTQKNVFWKRMYPTDDQLRSLVEDGVVEKRTMGQQKPPGGQKNDDYVRDGWAELEAKGYALVPGFKVVRVNPDGSKTVDDRFPCIHGVCFRK